MLATSFFRIPYCTFFLYVSFFFFFFILFFISKLSYRIITHIILFFFFLVSNMEGQPVDGHYLISTFLEQLSKMSILRFYAPLPQYPASIDFTSYFFFSFYLFSPFLLSSVLLSIFTFFFFSFLISSFSRLLFFLFLAYVL